jgi:hypothetical protein
MLPEHDYSIFDLPSLWAAAPSDIFAIAADSLVGDAQKAASQAEFIATRSCSASPLLSTDILAKQHHLRCGNSIVYRSAELEDLTGSALVLVLDMGSYYWSGTLKDPRSWAIINTALTYGITDISVWTAGNAGLSLAKLAHVANRRLLPEQRLQIHAIVDNEVAPEIRAELRLWQCEVLDVFRQDSPVLNPDEIRGLVAARLRRSRRRLEESSYWHVTDGWDGVGLMTYRLIAAQVIRDLSSLLTATASEPVNLVLPVGTGDLLVGFYLGLKDCEQAGLTSRDSWRLIGALPDGANILANIRQRTMHGVVQERGKVSHGGPPVMPKLKGLYTPLAPCITRIENEGAVEFVAVTEADQLRAGRQVLCGGIDDGVVAEPSALATFAALPHLGNSAAGRHGTKGHGYNSSQRTVIVNSGLGVLGRPEQIFLAAAMGAAAF